ncbi:hypothetical protein SLS58_011051 [Diplodia intermedia]|uniref:Uncharacterized protein n=1 Tax=Diplodia intermedia TaxID=856260 RepID=A0ABR3T2J3_9PEZI
MVATASPRKEDDAADSSSDGDEDTVDATISHPASSLLQPGAYDEAASARLALSQAQYRAGHRQRYSQEVEQIAQSFRNLANDPGLQDHVPELHQPKRANVELMHLVKVRLDPAWPALLQDLKQWMLKKGHHYERVIMEPGQASLVLPDTEAGEAAVSRLMKVWNLRRLSTREDSPVCHMESEERWEEIKNGLQLPLA